MESPGVASSRRKNLLASRRRREDDGEDEGEEGGSVAADLEDDSLSEGSIISNGDEDADVEASDISGDEMVKDRYPQPKPVQISSPNFLAKPFIPQDSGSRAAVSSSSAASNTENDPNRLQHDDQLREARSPLQQPIPLPRGPSAEDSRLQSQTPKQTAAESHRRQHLEYLRQKRQNPAFVPTRGGFFLHDNRAAPPAPNGSKATTRGRGGGLRNNGFPSRVPPPATLSDQPWAHDLHDSLSTTVSVARDAKRTSAMPNTGPADSSTMSPRADRYPPNRTFSTSVLIGSVPVGILFPGMRDTIIVENVAKRKHTLLPFHRPPLRRDKPVRISIPTQQPRYIFPTAERSFIFISRALRPNHQGFGRGRGRNSNPSRRTSVYGGSSYASSVAMSRGSSMGGLRSSDEVRSPGDYMLSLSSTLGTESKRPVSRILPLAPPNGVLSTPTPRQDKGAWDTAGPSQGFLPNDKGRETLSSNLTMHQPRPQKAVYVADIESPGRFISHPPQQQEMPFHQQMPLLVHHHQPHSEGPLPQHAHARQTSRASGAGTTPLSHIPERAIFAQPFRPSNPPPAAPGYLPSVYGPGTMFYPAMQDDPTTYHTPYGPSILAPAFLPDVTVPPPMTSTTTSSLPPPAPADGGAGTGTVAHESNGMVYYYDSSQIPPTTSAPYAAGFPGPSPLGRVETGGMMTSLNHPFYPDAQNGLYYAVP